MFKSQDKSYETQIEKNFLLNQPTYNMETNFNKIGNKKN